MTRWTLLLVTMVACWPSMTLAAVNTDTHIFVRISISNGSPKASTFARGVNDRGEIVGYYDAESRNRGFVISGSGFIRVVDFPGAKNTMPSSINSLGQIVGDYGDTTFFPGSGFLITNNGSRTINYPMTTGPARGINSAGQIVGSFNRPGGSSGYVFDGRVWTAINFPNSLGTLPEGINNPGQIVGTYILSDGVHGFLFNQGVFTRIDFPGGHNTRAQGINDAGDIVGSYESGGTTHGFLLSRGSFSSVDFPASFSTIANGINDSGVIVGSYTDNNGLHGWVATPRAPLANGD